MHLGVNKKVSETESEKFKTSTWSRMPWHLIIPSRHVSSCLGMPSNLSAPPDSAAGADDHVQQRSGGNSTWELYTNDPPITDSHRNLGCHPAFVRRNSTLPNFRHSTLNELSSTLTQFSSTNSQLTLVNQPTPSTLV